MEKGTLELKTNGGQRKMSYSLVDNTYYMATKSNSNKIAQIKKDSNVTIDLNDKKYITKLISKDESNYNDTKEIYLSTMPKFQRFIYKNLFGKKNDMFIILEVR